MFYMFYKEIRRITVVFSCFTAPWVFTYIFGFVKPILSARTMSKVVIFDSNQVKWKEALLNNIPSSSLPINYGGSGAQL